MDEKLLTDMYYWARGYLKSAHLLNIQALSLPQLGQAYERHEVPYMWPSVILFALGIEIFFKTLYYSHFGELYVPPKGSSGHRFDEIFSKLPIQAQNDLSILFEIHRTPEADASADHLATIEDGPPLDKSFASILTVWSRIFLRTKYGYEPMSERPPAVYMTEIQTVVLVYLRGRHQNLNWVW